MITQTSLPIKLAAIRHDLHDVLEAEPEGTPHWNLIDQAEKAIDQVLQEFERQGQCTWLAATVGDEAESS